MLTAWTMLDRGEAAAPAAAWLGYMSPATARWHYVVHATDAGVCTRLPELLAPGRDHL